MSFEFDKIVMTKNNVFVGKEYCDQVLFVLNVSEIINEFESCLLLILLTLIIFGMLDWDM